MTGPADQPCPPASGVEPAATDRIDDAQAAPLISVCVPMYNNAATIERCLRSVLDQHGVEFEIVIVDDQSTDDGAAIAATLLRAGDRLIRNDARLGLNGNHNRCLALARGDYIQFLHGDDWLLPGALQTLARSLTTLMSGWPSRPDGCRPTTCLGASVAGHLASCTSTL